MTQSSGRRAFALFKTLFYLSYKAEDLSELRRKRAWKISFMYEEVEKKNVAQGPYLCPDVKQSA
jgi:hypothetical protein